MSSVLWRERDLLAAVVSEVGRPGCAGHGAVSSALDDLEDVQRRRRLAVEEACTALGLPRGGTLADLAVAAPAPWGDLLRHHIVALLDATSDVVAAVEQQPADGGP